MTRRLGKDKKLLLVPSEIVTRLMEISNRQGKPFYGFILEILEHVLRVYDSGGSIKEVADFYALFGVVRSLGAKIMPEEAFNHMIGKHYRTERNVLMEKWREFGKLCSESLMTKYKDPVEALSKFLAIVECNLNEVEVTSESGAVRIRCASPILSAENTELLASFIDGLMQGLNYKTRKQDYVRGIISLEYERMADSSVPDKAIPSRLDRKVSR